jgi:hypothetical protein
VSNDHTDTRFQYWAARFRTLFETAPGAARDALLEAAWDEAKTEDPYLTFRWDNCIDGCCPTGELLLLRLVHPKLHPHTIATMFPELIRSTKTHSAVVDTEDPE